MSATAQTNTQNPAAPAPAFTVEMKDGAAKNPAVDPQVLQALVQEYMKQGGTGTMQVDLSAANKELVAQLLESKGLYEEASKLRGKEFKHTLGTRFHSVMNSRAVQYTITFAVVGGLIVLGLRMAAKTFEWNIPLIAPRADARPARSAAR